MANDRPDGLRLTAHEAEILLGYLNEEAERGDLDPILAPIRDHLIQWDKDRLAARVVRGPHIGLTTADVIRGEAAKVHSESALQRTRCGIRLDQPRGRTVHIGTDGEVTCKRCKASLAAEHRPAPPAPR